jgi:pimeloyl-ACP methyl ester carboxylesterase
MPYVNNSGVRIHYQVDGNDKGLPLLLLHGGMGSLEDWYEFGWVKGLKDDYRLILIDARGHGHSDKLYDPEAYEWSQVVKDISMVMDEVGVGKAHYMGFSLGGYTGFAIAKYAPERLLSMIIMGAHPYSEPSERERWQRAFGQGMKAYLESAIPNSPRLVVTDWYVTRRLANDPEALILSLSYPIYVFEEVMPNNTIPCLLYVGTADPIYQQVKRCAEEMPNTQFFPLHGVAHGESMRMTHVVVPRVRRFLAEVNQSLELVRGD